MHNVRVIYQKITSVIFVTGLLTFPFQLPRHLFHQRKGLKETLLWLSERSRKTAMKCSILKNGKILQNAITPAHLKNYRVSQNRNKPCGLLFLILKTPHLLEVIHDTAQDRLILKAATGSQI